MTFSRAESFVGSRALGALLPVAAILAVALTFALTFAARPAHAADFVVTNTDGTGTVDGSLDRAIRVANANPGRHTIEFNIPESADPGIKTISPGFGLAPITEPVTVDGYSQPGSRPNTKEVGANAVILIEIDGSDAGSTSGLDIRADDVVVRGLAINRFTSGISVGGVGSVKGTRIEGNFVGTDPSGTLDLGNHFSGVIVREGGNNTIGGATPTSATSSRARTIQGPCASAARGATGCRATSSARRKTAPPLCPTAKKACWSARRATL